MFAKVLLTRLGRDADEWGTVYYYLCLTHRIPVPDSPHRAQGRQREDVKAAIKLRRVLERLMYVARLRVEGINNLHRTSLCQCRQQDVYSAATYTGDRSEFLGTSEDIVL